jgi:hypothetical protein
MEPPDAHQENTARKPLRMPPNDSAESTGWRLEARYSGSRRIANDS